MFRKKSAAATVCRGRAHRSATGSGYGWNIWMRLPQVSSSTAIVVGPALVGFVGKVTPNFVSRSCSFARSATMKDVHVWDVAAKAKTKKAECGNAKGVAWLGEKLLVAATDGSIKTLAPK